MSDTGSLFAALLSVQQEAPALKKTAKNPHFGNSYVPLDAIVETLNPILHKHGLVWTTLPSVGDYGPVLDYKLTHVETGQALGGSMSLLLSKQDAQGQGSAITYARRYALCAVLNLVAEDDDDGERAAAVRSQSSEPNGRAGRPSEKQVEFLHKLVKQKKPSVAQLKTLLTEVGAEGVEIEEGWPLKLTGGREGQVSALIERLRSGDLPKVEESSAPSSDVPGPDVGEFVHEPQSLEGTPWATS